MNMFNAMTRNCYRKCVPKLRDEPDLNVAEMTRATAMRVQVHEGARQGGQRDGEAERRDGDQAGMAIPAGQ